MTSDPAPVANAAPHLLDVRNLATRFATAEGCVQAVDGVSFHIDEGETLGLVGESGCGKSVTSLSVMRLIPTPPGEITDGSVLFEGTDLQTLSEREMRRVRGGSIGMIFQEPMTSLNPVLTIGRQITEALGIHLDLNKGAARNRAIEILARVGLPDPASRFSDYPHHLSGGQRQRVMIAMAISCNPKLLIADEATTALDVTIQAQILELLQSLCEELRMALLIITHNLGVVARYAQRVAVMYAGKIIETGAADEIYTTPRHPYTKALLSSVPRLDAITTTRLTSIEGEIPDLVNLPEGCAFAPRCRWVVDRCRVESPELGPSGGSHTAACWEQNRIDHDRLAELQQS
ncbi:MAG: ABC transporter ATP-binding protein [Dehalococcoidia bacterium]|nr:ABC transporter ATP-binding protein [Dehalococcoidia bacterium]